MTITLDGTTGITTPGLTNTGTETLVNLTTTGNTTLGDATTDTLTVGVTGIVKDASGNVGIGTASPAGKLDVYTSSNAAAYQAYFRNANAGSSAFAISGWSNDTTNNAGQIAIASSTNTTYGGGGDFIFLSNTGDMTLRTTTAKPMTFYTNSGERMRIDSSGNVGIGTASPSYKLDARGTVGFGDGANGAAYFNGGATAYAGLYLQYAGTTKGMIRGDGSGGALVFSGTSTTEQMRLDANGNLMVATTDSALTSGVGYKFQASTTIPAMGIVFNINTNASTYHLYNTNATNNGYRFYVGANGGVFNYSANNSNLSDERTKTNIQNAGNYLTKICAIPVRTFKYKDQSDDFLNLGVIAQEVESIAPELVNNEGFGETPEDGIPLKSIYQTDLQYALMKCIQEQQALIQSLTTRISALETQNADNTQQGATP